MQVIYYSHSIIYAVFYFNVWKEGVTEMNNLALEEWVKRYRHYPDFDARLKLIIEFNRIQTIKDKLKNKVIK